MNQKKMMWMLTRTQEEDATCSARWEIGAGRRERRRDGEDFRRTMILDAKIISPLSLYLSISLKERKKLTLAVSADTPLPAAAAAGELRWTVVGSCAAARAVGSGHSPSAMNRGVFVHEQEYTGPFWAQLGFQSLED